MFILKTKFLGFFVFALIFFANTQAFALSVNSVRFGVHEDTNRLVLDISEISDFRAFVLASPWRMVIDLPRFNWQAGAIVKPPQSGVSDIRQGALQPGISRIVFDLNRPVSIKSAFILPRQGERPNRLVIDFQSIAPADFAAEKGKIHGTLSVNNPATYTHRTAALADTPSRETRDSARAPVPRAKVLCKNP